MKRHFITIMSGLVALLALLVVLGLGTSPAKAEVTYQIATDSTFPPFEFANNKNKYVGIDIDLMHAIAKDQGFKVNMKPTSFNSAVQSVQSGQSDGVIAGMSITKEREATFDFSKPYFMSGVVMAAKPNGKITKLSQLRGKRVAVKTGTSGAQYAQSIHKKYGFRIVTFDESNDMYQDVLTGNSAACFEDSPVMKYAVRQGTKLKIYTKPTLNGPYGFGVKKGHNKKLLRMFNNGLADLKANGEYARITRRYLGAKGSSDTTSDRTFMGLIKQNKGALISGFKQTVWLTVVAIFFATLFGVIVGLLGVVPNKFFNGLSTTLIYIFRGLPLLVLALFIYTGIPSLTGQKIPAFIAGIITLMFNEGAYIAAFVKGGINAVDDGQMEAARSLGLPFGKAMRRVILPQGIRIMIPSFINQFIITLKDTSILSIIGIIELTQTGKIIIARNLEGFKVWTIVAIIYLIVITLLTWLSNWVQRRVRL
ncbi:glutamine ABC transporter substrate-binding and permease protein [Secundilactobacillus pentosiphilus]|uniref:Glutamine ABC transporter substrate-binding and permease protein n=1 Tax=Secundilactobacillus pentosiphilus TaxID=1714682 RepID=A0A1Z5IPL2_9LACO|nr:amino acid ABC transporter substrate-binding protein/permease [Secundilactobacillus pentosiphilus]GAX03636.1 glutamine ABC transporter substrate-binding and permease protein [Secundilactobacillus pentosiphilus]